MCGISNASQIDCTWLAASGLCGPNIAAIPSRIIPQTIWYMNIMQSGNNHFLFHYSIQLTIYFVPLVEPWYESPNFSLSICVLSLLLGKTEISELTRSTACLNAVSAVASASSKSPPENI